MLIGKYYTNIEESEQFGNYIGKLDAITFNEGFAHLVSYNQQEIDRVEWVILKLGRFLFQKRTVPISKLRKKELKKCKQHGKKYK